MASVTVDRCPGRGARERERLDAHRRGELAEVPGYDDSRAGTGSVAALPFMWRCYWTRSSVYRPLVPPVPPLKKRARTYTVTAALPLLATDTVSTCPVLRVLLPSWLPELL